jgi:pyruvate,water dikinase
VDRKEGKLKKLAGDQEFDKDIIEKVGEVSAEIEGFFGEAQDIEWCIENGNLFILQSRPITS